MPEIGLNILTHIELLLGNNLLIVYVKGGMHAKVFENVILR